MRLVHMMKSHPLRLHPLFSDHAVLQRHRVNPIWGWAAPGAQVQVEFRGWTASATAGDDGAWRLEIPALEAHEGSELRVSAGDHALVCRDVAVGEVWLGSGQSNMEWPVQFTENALEAIRAARDEGIRLFTVPRAALEVPRLVPGAACWRTAAPDSVPLFSAVGYFFAVELRRELGVPVGVIHASWGGSILQAWLPQGDPGAEAAAVETFAREWRAWAGRHGHPDPGNGGEGLGWAGPDHRDADWGEMLLPGFWEEQGLDLDGAVWFRKAVDLPAAWAGRDLVLQLGRVDDFDTTYFNGERVGGLGPETALTASVQRTYLVPGRLVRPGRNVLAVRVFDHAGGGGIAADTSAQFCLILPGSGAQLPLAGLWRMRVEAALESRPATVWASMPAPPFAFGAAQEPSLGQGSLFNGMIAPVVPYGLKGVLWYQGESNVHEAAGYAALLQRLHEGWRELWGGSLAFCVVQLADWMHPSDAQVPPGHSPWAALREAQASVRSWPDAVLAVARDLGDPYDIHPRKKREVGQRLAWQALRRFYGQNVHADGPVPLSWEAVAPALRIRFQAKGGLRGHEDGQVYGFLAAGADRRFHPAEARILNGNEIEVTAAAVQEPCAVRYAWEAFSRANLTDEAGLPAAPFRTDDWPLAVPGFIVKESI